jgi:hypothetical protein
VAGRALAARLSEADSQEAIRRAYQAAREKVPRLLRIALDGIVDSLVDTVPDADASTPNERPSDAPDDVITLVEGEDYVVCPDRGDTDT